MGLKGLAYRVLPRALSAELRHQKHLRDLATAVEPEEPIVRPLVAPGQTILDIGANFGVFTKLFSGLVGPTGRVFAFEPVPQTFRTLAAGVERLNLHNVTPMNKAVSDHVGSALMFIPEYPDSKGENLYESRIVAEDRSKRAFSVETITIDSLQLSNVDFIKIDVEGHELEVLHGGSETIRENRPVLMVEVTSDRTTKFLCESLGYEQPVIASPSNFIFIHTARLRQPVIG